MGSLTSRPVVPAIPQPQIITVAAPAPLPVVTPVSVDTSTPAPTPDQVAAQARSAGLLERSRGILSTVLTGFRGVLDQSSASTPQRKSLLGE